MSVRSILTKIIILPLSDFLLKRTISKHLSFLNKSQWWSKSELENFQNKRVKMLMEHSYKNVPYYTNLLNSLNLKPADFQKVEDLKKLPILTKEGIRTNFPDLISDKSREKGTFMRASSSGSTGEPLQYFLSKDAYSFNIAAGLRAWSWMGYKLGDKYIKISQNQRSSKEKKLQDKLMNNEYLFLKDIDDESLKEAIQIIANNNPKIIRCYPDPLEFLAEIILENNVKMNLKAIATTGNVLHKSAREKIEKAFSAKIYDGYSCEGSAPFFQCENHEFYHAAVEYAFSEFVDVVETESGVFQGRHIVTNLWNFTTPFIRYDSQDILEWEEKDCSCGRKLLNVRRIIGRDNDVLITPKGKRLIVHIFTIYFSKVEEVKQFQIVQNSENSIVINLIVKDSFNDETKANILNYWSEIIDDEAVKIDIVLKDEIKASASGKRRFIIKNF
jgi:phenylacetate-CoA ligase